MKIEAAFRSDRQELDRLREQRDDLLNTVCQLIEILEAMGVDQAKITQAAILECWEQK